MSFAVVVVIQLAEQTEKITGFGGAYHRFLNDIRDTAGPVGTAQRPNENLWLLSLHSGTPTLAYVVTAAQKHQIPHRVLYFEKPPAEYSFESPPR